MSESPDKFHFWTAISSVAACLRRRVHLNMGYFEWVPNFYVIFVAPPGIVSKSTTANIGMRLLREVPNIKFGPNVVTWEALVKGFAGASEPIERKDGTIDTMAALTVCSSELGNLLDPTNRQMVDLLVTLWDCERGTLDKVTKTMGNDRVTNPWINIIGCTTPEWISGTFPQYVVGGGFTSRCIFVYAEEKRRLVAYPHLSMDEHILAMRPKLIEDLTQISLLEGPFQMTKDAILWGQAWYEEHYEKVKKQAMPMALKGYMARKQTHLHKIAMVLSAAQGDKLVLDVSHMEEASSILIQVEGDMPKVFSHIGLTAETRILEELVHMMARVKRIRYQQAYRFFARVATAQQFDVIVLSAQKAGFINVAPPDLLIYSGDDAAASAGSTP